MPYRPTQTPASTKTDEVTSDFPADLGDFNDNNVGKVLDNIHSYGASKLFSQVSWQACQRYDLDSRFLHYDTTSVNVYGDYAAYAQATENTIAITHGHSKDKRPDLKQFMMEALCVKGGVAAAWSGAQRQHLRQKG